MRECDKGGGTGEEKRERGDVRVSVRISPILSISAGQMSGQLVKPK